MRCEPETAFARWAGPAIWPSPASCTARSARLPEVRRLAFRQLQARHGPGRTPPDGPEPTAVGARGPPGRLQNLWARTAGPEGRPQRLSLTLLRLGRLRRRAALPSGPSGPSVSRSGGHVQVSWQPHSSPCRSGRQPCSTQLLVVSRSTGPSWVGLVPAAVRRRDAASPLERASTLDPVANDRRPPRISGDLLSAGSGRRTGDNRRSLALVQGAARPGRTRRRSRSLHCPPQMPKLLPVGQRVLETVLAHDAAPAEPPFALPRVDPPRLGEEQVGIDTHAVGLCLASHSFPSSSSFNQNSPSALLPWSACRHVAPM